MVAVDGAGTVHRCHSIAEPIGNLDEPGFEAAPVERSCTNVTCGCHLGHVPLGLTRIFGPGHLERIPEQPIWRPEVIAGPRGEVQGDPQGSGSEG